VQRETDEMTSRITLMTRLVQSKLQPIAEGVRLSAGGDGLGSYRGTGTPHLSAFGLNLEQWRELQPRGYDR
jgi:hypothetical protein